ncbi:MAG: 3-oxoacyl-ACP reductase FabG [Oscillospiraceae bacterium]|nr:3-oxoacyl-ACP reductase FabG [Oscillospiraceae bacterium]
MMKAVVTGASRGIGKAVAEALLKQGYDVTGTYIHSGEEAEKMRRKGIAMLKCDVRDYDAVHELAEELHGAHVLVNNAGIAEEALFTDITPQMWDDMFDVNVKGVYNFCHAFVPSMVHEKYGRIINISSVWGEVGASCEVHYSAAKAAVIGFTKALAKELAPSGITVNCIAPGVIDTDMVRVFDDEVLKELAEETPVGRLGTPEDIACGAVFLASPAASFVTGQVLGINGLFGH